MVFIQYQIVIGSRSHMQLVLDYHTVPRTYENNFPSGLKRYFIYFKGIFLTGIFAYLKYSFSLFTSILQENENSSLLFQGATL